MAPDAMNTPEHEEAWLLIPWWVNGSLADADEKLVRTHLTGCATCRQEVAAQSRLRESMVNEDRVAYAPQAGFEKLWSRIEELERDAPGAVQNPSLLDRPAAFPSPVPGPMPPYARPRPQGLVPKWLLAVVLGQAVGLALLTAAFLQARMQTPTQTPTPSPVDSVYRTVTVPKPGHGADLQIRAVFASHTTLAEVGMLIRATGLTVISGPTEHGVYTLGLPAGTATTAATLARLRASPQVLFAEPVP